MIGDMKQEAQSGKPDRLLYRSEKERVLGGVAGGIAKYFEVDANLVRFTFILITLLGGAGIPLYFILWLLLPGESSLNKKGDTLKKNIDEIKGVASKMVEEIKSHEKEERNNGSQKWLAVFLILIGVLFLMNNFGMLWWFSFDRLWPIILIGLGVVVLLRHENK